MGCITSFQLVVVYYWVYHIQDWTWIWHVGIAGQEDLVLLVICHAKYNWLSLKTGSFNSMGHF
jgi:hypothetical protein